jgi:hypothetical protein
MVEAIPSILNFLRQQFHVSAPAKKSASA